MDMVMIILTDQYTSRKDPAFKYLSKSRVESCFHKIYCNRIQEIERFTEDSQMFSRVWPPTGRHLLFVSFFKDKKSYYRFGFLAIINSSSVHLKTITDYRLCRKASVRSTLLMVLSVER